MDPEEILQITSTSDDQNPGWIQVNLAGKLSSDAAKWFRSEINRLLISGYREIDLDLSSLQYIDSFGLAELVPAYLGACEKKGTLRIINPRRLIRHILVSAHLDDVIEIGPAQEK
ncbi:MAG: STAS domain-containing protein [Candidatus Omnitrophica bacterium]|nr:MAG: hypothetical protein UZ16_OP3001002597 [Candidatus Hinthialibacteria bacterium OLB16]MBE7487219.1 STAS domain-containing protein [bacterium]MBK7493886.1 STAS domain-containing protein [Candidatus Omnitrophota bacterium]MBV6481711.1 hypothetical protein [bacterium]MBW7938339.1 STAS domain-containing protein [Candidatus Omnitrophota bacterium]